MNLSVKEKHDSQPRGFPHVAMLKSELGMMYFTDCSPSEAGRKLVVMVRKNLKLMQELRDTGYYSVQKYLTPRQVGLIVKYLGAPWIMTE